MDKTDLISLRSLNISLPPPPRVRSILIGEVARGGRVILGRVISTLLLVAANTDPDEHRSGGEWDNL